MRALMICPEWPDTYWSFKHALPFEGKRSAYPPLGLLTVASMLPKTWEKRLIDMNVKPLRDRDLKWADVVMVGAMLVQTQGTIDILKRCRAMGIRTVVGGPIAGTMPAVRELADHVVVGEAEEVMESFCRALEEGNAEFEYKGAELPELSKTPLPDLSLINPKHYSSMAIQFSRGCPFNCEFCDIIEMFGRRPRTKPIPQVLAELDQLVAMGWTSSVFLVDDNFIGNKKSVKELLPAMAEWNEQNNNVFSFFTEASVNLADDEDLLKMMQRAGFFRVFLGIETPEEESLKIAQKYQNTKRSLLDSVKRLQRYGLEVMAGFIVGFDTDTDQVFDKQVAFIQESAVPLAMVGLLQALPGTQLYRRLIKEGRLIGTGQGSNTELSLNFLPKMDPKLLVEGYRSILQRIYSAEAYYDRVRSFLSRYDPGRQIRPRKWSDYRAFCLSLWHQGVLSGSRRHYWKFLFDAATRYRNTFSTAMTLAIMGHHLQVITAKVLEAEVYFEPLATIAAK